MKMKKEEKQDGVVKAKPHVCKRLLTSASALYSFLTAAHIPVVGPGIDGGAGVCSLTPLPPHQEQKAWVEGQLWTCVGILFIIFWLHSNVFFNFWGLSSLFIKLPLLLILFLTFTRTQAGFLSLPSEQCGSGQCWAGFVHTSDLNAQQRPLSQENPKSPNKGAHSDLWNTALLKDLNLTNYLQGLISAHAVCMLTDSRPLAVVYWRVSVDSVWFSACFFFCLFVFLVANLHIVLVQQRAQN